MTTQISDAGTLRPQRPRIRQDVAFLETLDGVYVRSLDGSFMIRGAGAYRYLSALLPHLDGATPLADLVAGLPEAHQRTVTSLVNTLASRGVVADGPDLVHRYDDETRSRFAGQLALLDHHGDDGAGFGRALSAQVGIVCAEPGPAGALAESLAANGVGAGAGGGVRTATPDEIAAGGHGLELICLLAPQRPHPDLFALADAAHRDGATFVSLLRVGDQLVLGPLHGAGGAADLHSAILRMSDNGIDGTDAVWQATSIRAAAPRQGAVPEAAVAMAVSLLGFEVFKATTGSITSDLSDAVVVLDPLRLTVRQEPVIPHPASPRAGRAVSGDAVAAAPAPGTAAAASARQNDDITGESATEEAYTRFERAVADTVGVLRRFDDDTLPQIPVKIARLEAPAVGRHHLVSYGSDTVLEARLAALEDAAVQYATTIQRRCTLLPPAAPGAGHIADHQLEAWLGVPRTDASTVAATAWGDDGRQLAVPRAAVLAGPWDRDAAWFEPTLDGVRAAPTASEAASRALLDAAGAAAIRAIARGEEQLHPVRDHLLAEALPAERHTLLTTLVNELADDGSQVGLYLGRGVVPVAVVHLRGGTETVTACAGRSWDEAAEQALLRLVGARQLAAAGVDAPAAEGPVPGLSSAIVGQRATELPAGVVDEEILGRLSDRGRHVAVVDLTPPDLDGITHVARALVYRTTTDRP
ncbi:hypothetical protein [Phytoactinopolyspora halotolerans]|uniref:YcaO domain-containing protein n=1 Tax=Phytoactinopolyspora halotolerans TaxID=1981512 RepID=A0A6L9SE71_9ACTN|nr:hypothetical protein [Phytoactinopolyspora halotolerans]NEE03715.1 hypothetical protein [Phytoactinopolyspora halotolerans]